MHKSKLLYSTEAGEANRILKNATFAVPLKYLSNFWRSLEMLLINCKVELNGQSILFCLQLVQIMQKLILIILVSLSNLQSYMFLLKSKLLRKGF